jgi:hypothetical protein
MKALLLLGITAVITPPAFAEEAPLELGRPNATPITIERKLDPPPVDPTIKPKKVRKVKKAAETVGAATTPVTTPTPSPTPAGPPPAAAPGATATTTPAPVETPAATPPAATATTAAPVTTPPPATPAPGGKKKKTSANAESVTQTKEGGEKPVSLRHRALLNFRFANIWAIRNRTNTGSFIGSWDPVIQPWKRFNFGVSLGVTQFESETVAGRSADTFLVFEYGVSASYYLSRIFLPELVIGAQTWNESGASSTDPLIAVNLNFLFKKRPFGYLDRVYGGFGSLQVSGGSTNILRGGIGLRF